MNRISDQLESAIAIGRDTARAVLSGEREPSKFEEEVSTRMITPQPPQSPLPPPPPVQSTPLSKTINSNNSEVDHLLDKYNLSLESFSEVGQQQHKIYTSKAARLWKGGNPRDNNKWEYNNRLDENGVSILHKLGKQSAQTMSSLQSVRELIRLQYEQVSNKSLSQSDSVPETILSTIYSSTTTILERIYTTLTESLHFVIASTRNTAPIENWRKIITLICVESRMDISAYGSSKADNNMETIYSEMVSNSVDTPGGGKRFPALHYSSTIGEYHNETLEKQTNSTVTSYTRPDSRKTHNNTTRSLAKSWEGSGWSPPLPIPPAPKHPSDIGRVVDTRNMLDVTVKYNNEPDNKLHNIVQQVEEDATLHQSSKQLLSESSDSDVLENAIPSIDEVNTTTKSKRKNIKIRTLTQCVEEYRRRRRIAYKSLTLREKEWFILFNQTELLLHHQNALNNMRIAATRVSLNVLMSKPESTWRAFLRKSQLEFIRSSLMRSAEIEQQRWDNMKRLHFLNSGRFSSLFEGPVHHPIP